VSANRTSKLCFGVRFAHEGRVGGVDTYPTKFSLSFRLMPHLLALRRERDKTLFDFISGSDSMIFTRFCVFLIMTRSLKKGPYVDERLLKKIVGKKPGTTGVIKTWSRACVVAPEFVGFTFGVHNGRDHVEVFITEDMVGHRLGEFSLTRKFVKHGGKMQKELETKKKEAEVAAASSAKASTEAKK